MSKKILHKLESVFFIDVLTEIDSVDFCSVPDMDTQYVSLTSLEIIELAEELKQLAERAEHNG